MHRLIPIRPALLALMFAVPALAQAQQAKPLAILDGTPITEEDLKTASDDIGANLPQMTDDQKKKYLIDYLIDLKLLARAAEKQKLGEGPEFARKLVYLKDRSLMEGLMTKVGEEGVSPEKLKAFYEDAVKGLKPDPEVRARHILIAEEADAKAAYARVKGGEDFAKVAAELSKDPGSGKEGGDLGYFTKDRMVAEFADAAFKMKAGEISEPVKSQFGWHIIKVEDVRTKPVPALDQVKDELTKYLAQKSQQDVIVKLRSEARIERMDEPKPVEAKPVEPKK